MKTYMGLTCKPGKYDDVLKKLLFGVFVDPRDMYLLSGEVDILIQFDGLRNLEEFVETWFNPIRLIEAKDELVTNISSFIVISESLVQAEKPSAFVFMNSRPGNVENVRHRLLSIPSVLSAGSVLGPFDLISSVKAKNGSDLERVVSTIQSVPGVENLTVSVVDSMNIFPDW